MKTGSSKKHGAQGREPRSLQRLVSRLWPFVLRSTLERSYREGRALYDECEYYKARCWALVDERRNLVAYTANLERVCGRDGVKKAQELTANEVAELRPSGKDSNV